MSENCDHFLINLALERNDPLRQFLHGLPFPAIKFCNMANGWRIDGNFAFIAFKAIGKPFLGLTAIFAFQCPANQMWWQIIIDPIWRFLKQSYAFHPRSEERRVGKECISRWSP